VFILLELLRRLLHRLGLVRASSSADRELSDADQAWRLIGDPALWALWMPTVLDRIDRPRPIQAGGHFRFSLRLEASRMWLGGATEGHVVVDEYVPAEAFTWRIVTSRGQQRFSLRQDGPVTHCEADHGPAAAAVLAELDRQSAS
jgi:hypothetical protein